MKPIETVFKNGKHYKGTTRFAKLDFNGKYYKVERRRPFGWDSRTITKHEYDFITNRKRAAQVFGYRYYMGIAAWWGGEIKHPIKDFNTIADEVLSNAESYKSGLHYNDSLVDVVAWMFANYEPQGATP